MDREIKARWIEALRDPEAMQVRGRLGYVDGGRCCLGVLCDIAVADGVIAAPVPFGDVLDFDGMSDIPTLKVHRYAGLPARVSQRLSAMNDNGKTFSEIADHIEYEL